MTLLGIIRSELVVFLGIRSWIDMAASHDYSSLHTYHGIASAIEPLIPFLLVFETIRALIHQNFKIKDYKLIFFTYVANRVLSSLLSIGAMAYCIALFEPYSIFRSSITWYWVIYGYVVFELGHFMYHYSAHKVRLLWCLHSTHHAPESMNLFVSHAHFFLELPYADVIRTSVGLLLGVSPPLLFAIRFVDGTWGAFVHAGENLIRDGRLGFLNRVILTPSHHRVHHARNPLYIDTNFCNLLNIWDRVFGTLQDERVETPPEYGITRAMKVGSFWDFYFGEIVALSRDVKNAPGVANKVAYIIRPPGWSHTGEHKTATVVRKALVAKAG
jgi:sterol desaturase/sphingolipid hydroxylase (fatty acid hydroxylase superfamily)